MMDAELLVKMEEKAACSWCNEGGGGGVFRRLALLPYIPDQKYTLGRHYTSREEQGEFIFCDVEGVSENPGGHFEIKCGDVGFFIKPLEGAGDVALNGRELSPEDQPVLLKFGEEIQLGVGRGRVIMMLRVPHYSSGHSPLDLNDITACLKCRKEKGISQSRGRAIEAEGNGDGDAEFRHPSPLENPLILNEIFQFLSTHDLRQGRLVSPLWTVEATRLLMKKTLLPLHLSSKDPKRWQSLFYWHSQMRPTFSHSRGFKIYMAHDREAEPDDDARLFTPWVDDHADDKLIEDLSLYFLPLVPQLQLTTLHLLMNLKTPLDLDILTTILATTGPHLHTLGLTLYPFVNADEDGEDAYRFGETLMAFPALRQLRIGWTMSFVEEGAEYDVRKEGMWASFLENFVQSQKGLLEAFEIFTDETEVCQRCLNALTDSPFIKELIIRGDEFFPVFEPALDRLLLTFPPGRLTHLVLEIGILEEDWTEAGAQGLSKILQNQAQSLQKLKLTLAPPPSNKNIAFPSMPVLKVLEVDSYYEVDGAGVGVPGGGGVTFPECDGGVLNYSRNFPQLHTLKVYPVTYYEDCDVKRFEDVWLLTKAVMGVWFPLDEDDQDEPCRTVVNLDVPYTWKNKEGHTLLTKGVDLKKLKKAFPNAVLPKLEDALRGWRNRVLAVSAELNRIAQSGGDDDEIEAAIWAGTALTGMEEAIKEFKRN